MKLLLKLLIAGVVLMATGFAQELKRAAVAQEPVAQSQASTEQIIATGVRHRPAPMVQPKALPPLESISGRNCPQGPRRSCRGPEGASWWLRTTRHRKSE